MGPFLILTQAGPAVGQEERAAEVSSSLLWEDPHLGTMGAQATVPHQGMPRTPGGEAATSLLSTPTVIRKGPL